MPKGASLVNSIALGYLFSANDAFSIVAWGNAQDFGRNEMSAESAIQPVYANHADHVEAALSALCCYVYDFLGRCPRLGMTARRWR